MDVCKKKKKSEEILKNFEYNLLIYTEITETQVV